MRGAQECTGSTRGGKRPSAPGHQCPPGDTLQGRRQQGAFPTPGKQRPCLGPDSTLICGLGCREVEGGGEKTAAELWPVIGLDNMEDQEGAQTVELGGPGWVRPPTQGPPARNVAKLQLLPRRKGPGDPPTGPAKMGAGRGHLTLGSEREAVDRRQARAGQTWRNARFATVL